MISEHPKYTLQLKEIATAEIHECMATLFMSRQVLDHAHEVSSVGWQRERVKRKKERGEVQQCGTHSATP